MRNLCLITVMMALIHFKGFCQSISYQIDPNTLKTLYIEVYNGDKKIATASGFLTQMKNRVFLITNWHVVTNREYFNMSLPLKEGGRPTKLIVFFHKKDSLGKFLPIELTLKKANKDTWVEGILKGELIDVIALEVAFDERISYSFVDVQEPELQIIPNPSEQVFIIGFPHGKSPHPYFPFWKSGILANDIILNGVIRGIEMPVFFIDSTTRPGMSGSPVLFIGNKNVYNQAQNSFTKFSSDAVVNFMGIYSGQSTEMELGVVFSRVTILELLKSIVNK
jgi:Trypsin-like peptidase domain